MLRDLGIQADQHEVIIDISAIRKGQVFCTLTKSTITIWQAKVI